jgi:GntR family transcriptional regulator/MocR family aminotransferase
MRDPATRTLIALLERDPASNASLTLQLQTAIRRLIIEGHAKEGDRLPSSRALGKEIGLARDTVESAYRHLEMEGFLRRRSGSGTFVAAAKLGFLDRRQSGGARRGAVGNSGSKLELSARGEEIATGGGVTDYGEVRPFVVLPDVELFPLDVWQKLTARVIRNESRSALLYADPMGFPALREEIASYLAAPRGVICSAAQVLVLTSSQQALGLIATMLINPGEKVGVEDPGFHGAQFSFRAAGVETVPIPVDESGLTTDGLPQLDPSVRAIYVTPSHQYPTGVTMSLSRRLALLDWAARSKAWIVEDDYDSEFRYIGRPVAAIQGLNRPDRVLYVGTFSKVLFPGLRLAYLVLPRNS